MSKPICILFVMVGLLPSAPALADSAAATFNRMFADKIHDVGSTFSDTSDDLALAREMVQAVTKHTAEPELVAILCDRAYKLASQDPAGADTAIEALNMLAVVTPSRELESRRNIVDLRSTQYTASRGAEKARVAERLIDETIALGEALEQTNDYNAALLTYRRAGSVALATRSSRVKLIQAGIKAAADRQSRFNLMQKLLKRAEQNSDDAAMATQIARMYLFDFDDPASAAPFATKSDDEAIRNNVALMQQPIKSLDAEQARTLGAWYQGKGFLSDPAMRGALHLRAHAFYRRAYDAAKDQDALQRQVLASLDTLNLSLQEVGITPPATPMLAVADAPQQPVPVKPAPAQPKPQPQPKTPVTVVADTSPNDPPRSELLRRPVDDPTQPRRGRPTFFGIPAD